MASPTIYAEPIPRQPGLRHKALSGDLPVYAAVVLGYLLLAPPQFNLSIAGSAIPPYRFFLIGAVLYVIPALLKGRLRITWPDIAITSATGWIAVAMVRTSDLQEAITSSIAHFNDVLVAYLFARLAFRNIRDLRLFLILMLPGLILTGFVIAIEAATHTHIIQAFASQVTGQPLQYDSTPRMGLMRAQGPFPHPILAGIFFSSFLPLYWLSGLRRDLRFAGVFAACCSFFTVSSVAFLALAASVCLLLYNWLTERIANASWSIFFVLAGLGCLAAELGTKTGAFGLIIRFASFNTMSGYNRILIWEYGAKNVAKQPWFGIGYADWERPIWMVGSMDNYWLLLAVRFGFPVSVLIGVAVALALVMIARKSVASPIDQRRCERGSAISLGVYALCLISVSAWLSAQVWFFLLLGLTVSLSLARSASPSKHEVGTYSRRPTDRNQSEP